MLKHLVESVLSLVFPAPCEICGAARTSLGTPGVCEKCFTEIRLIEPPHCARCGRTLKTSSGRCGECGSESFHFDRAFACTWYDGPIQKLLHLYKFGRRKSLRRFLTALMRQFIEHHVNPADFDAVIAVPLDRARKNSRGFNQSELLSKTLAGAFKKKHLHHSVLRRRRAPTPQSSLTKAGRRENVRDAFSVRKTGAVQSQKLLLVDDILTTGQTASECARALKQAGARSVTVLAFARGK